MKILEINASDFDQDNFLKQYWQKQALLIRSYLAKDLALISPEELAGLACEEGIESRIVKEVKNKDKSCWDLSNGPFDEQVFQNLPEDKWSLLVQSVDHWSPDVFQMLKHFRFLPAHILDDVMVSFAPKGGSVGPHFDYYDVFLVQGMGSRRWQIGQECDENTPYSINSQLLILDEFKEEQEFILNTGDVLYLPPKVAHWGTALEDCITYSVGFRTPSISQSIIAFTDDLTDRLHEKNRLVFPVTKNAYQIDNGTISELKDQIAQHLLDEENLLLWYGCFSTEAKNENSLLALEDEIGTADLIDLLNREETIYKNEGSRFIYSVSNNMHLFADGKHFVLDNSLEGFVKLLCESDSIKLNDVEYFLANTECCSVLVSLINSGSLYIENI